MKLHKKTIKDVPLHNKTVLVRAGFDVPLNEKREVEDDLRLEAGLPTLRYLLDQNCKVVVMAHLGRPEGHDDAFSLRPVAKRLEELLGEKVLFVNSTVGHAVKMAVKKAPATSVILLENLRFEAGEKANSFEFAKQLAQDTGARYFVQDAFSNVHREDASMAAITECIPSVAGLQVTKEVETISSAMEHPKRPLVAILGGAKVSDKIGVIEQFVKKADRILIGGAMANTFLAYKGHPVGTSKVETEQFDTVKRIYEIAGRKRMKLSVDEFIMIPTDVAIATKPEASAQRKVVGISDIPEGAMCLDIGDATIQRYVDIIKQAKTVVWNGTLGYAELSQFAHGSARVAMELATHPEALSIIGGGDTADFVRHWDSRGGKSFSHVSTGGGASLELMAGEPLPGVEHLLDA